MGEEGSYLWAPDKNNYDQESLISNYNVMPSEVFHDFSIIVHQLYYEKIKIRRNT